MLLVVRDVQWHSDGVMIENVTGFLVGRGVDRVKIHRECFFNAVHSA